MFELSKEELEKVVGGADSSGENTALIHKCKYDLGWTKQQYLNWCWSQGATESEIAAASATWDMA